MQLVIYSRGVPLILIVSPPSCVAADSLSVLGQMKSALSLEATIFLKWSSASVKVILESGD
jgi:hypothetical protein